VSGLLLPSRDWFKSAKCHIENQPTDFFFIGRGGPNSNRIAGVKDYCEPCKVKKECLEWAIESDSEFGMFGGKTPAEIKKIRKHRNTGKLVPNGNRDKTHCGQGHPFNQMNTYNRSNGSRSCRACHKERNIKWRRRRA